MPKLGQWCKLHRCHTAWCPYPWGCWSGYSAGPTQWSEPGHDSWAGYTTHWGKGIWQTLCLAAPGYPWRGGCPQLIPAREEASLPFLTRRPLWVLWQVWSWSKCSTLGSAQIVPGVSPHLHTLWQVEYFDDLCRDKDRPRNACAAKTSAKTHTTDDHEQGAVFNTLYPTLPQDTDVNTSGNLCTIQASNHHGARQGFSLDHHIYDNLCDCWVRQSSKPQPYITVHVSVSAEDFTDLRYQLSSTPTSATLPAMSDTGCQSCLAGIKVLTRLSISTADLIPVSMKMHAANNNAINIIGAVVLRFYGESVSGDCLETRQLTYVTDSSDRLFLSREACVALGMISPKFPRIGEALSVQDSTSAVSGLNPGVPLDVAPCGCPKRSPPPPPPGELPYPTTGDNREQLQDFLMDHYGASTFKKCLHQPLPMMDSPWMRMMVDPDAQPVAHHKAIPVPIHWCGDVKAGLNKDVSLGVLEPVPIGEPVSWCHMMVVCAKKDDTPRRTVDFPSPQQTWHTWDTSHAAIIPPSSFSTSQQEEDCLWCLEWVPQCSTAPWRSPPDHVHHALGGTIDTVLLLRDMPHLEMPTLGATTTLWHTSQTKPNVLTTHCSGQTQVSDRQSTGLMSVAEMGSYSTHPQSSLLLPLLMSLQVPRWHLLLSEPASNTWRPSWSSQLQPTSLTFALGLAWSIKSAMPSVWPSGWPHFANSWSPIPRSTGIRTWTHSSWNPNSRLCMRLSMVSASLIRVSQRALLRIGPRLVSGSGCSRNTAAAPMLSHSAVVTDGVSLWWGAGSLTQLNRGMRPLRVRPWL